jgi:hypothetical protein
MFVVKGEEGFVEQKEEGMSKEYIELSQRIERLEKAAKERHSDAQLDALVDIVRESNTPRPHPTAEEMRAKPAPEANRSLCACPIGAEERCIHLNQGRCEHSKPDTGAHDEEEVTQMGMEERIAKLEETADSPSLRGCKLWADCTTLLQRTAALEKITCIKGNENANAIASATARVAANEVRILALEERLQTVWIAPINALKERCDALESIVKGDDIATSFVKDAWRKDINERIEKIETAVASLKLCTPPPEPEVDARADELKSALAELPEKLRKVIAEELPRRVVNRRMDRRG